VIASPVCAQTGFCLDVMDWIATSRDDEAPVIRARTLGLTERYLMRRLTAEHALTR
jgi:hypothetical protein